MELGKVKGQIVTTIRDPRLPPCSLLLVDICDATGKETGGQQVAADPIGAGIDEWVLLARGSSARLGLAEPAPVDLCVVGIIDQITGGGRVLYDKANADIHDAR